MAASPAPTEGPTAFERLRSQLIFCMYVGLYISFGLLVTASKDENGDYPYNTVTVIMLTEATKLFITAVAHVREGNTLKSWFTNFSTHFNVYMLYLVPAGLYGLYNILSYHNLAQFDPTTYFILLQLRTLLTAAIWMALFNKKLSMEQYASLVILTFGCILQTLDDKGGAADGAEAEEAKKSWSEMLSAQSAGLISIFIQMLCSCFAGVYNEKLLKDTSKADVSLMTQNSFMYAHSIVFNLIVLGYRGQLADAMTAESMSQTLSQPIVVALVINNAFMGICVSIFLKYLNSILKAYATGCEVAATAVMSWILFSIPIRMYTYVSMMFVGVATYIYTMYPVQDPKNPPK